MENNNARILGKLIHDKRKEKGYTLEELGSLLGVTKNAIYRYEKGLIKDIPFEKRIMLADFLEIPPQDLDFDGSFTLDRRITALSGNENILKYAFEANRLTNIFLNELHNSNSIVPLLNRENYILIDKAAFSNPNQIQRIIKAVEYVFNTPSSPPEQSEQTTPSK